MWNLATHHTNNKSFERESYFVITRTTRCLALLWIRETYLYGGMQERSFNTRSDFDIRPASYAWKDIFWAIYFSSIIYQAFNLYYSSKIQIDVYSLVYLGPINKISAPKKFLQTILSLYDIPSVFNI